MYAIRSYYVAGDPQGESELPARQRTLHQIDCGRAGEHPVGLVGSGGEFRNNFV